jgi:hypothetical protein
VLQGAATAAAAAAVAWPAFVLALNLLLLLAQQAAAKAVLGEQQVLLLLQEVPVLASEAAAVAGLDCCLQGVVVAQGAPHLAVAAAAALAMRVLLAVAGEAGLQDAVYPLLGVSAQVFAVLHRWQGVGLAAQRVVGLVAQEPVACWAWVVGAASWAQDRSDQAWRACSLFQGSLGLFRLLHAQSSVCHACCCCLTS